MRETCGLNVKYKVFCFKIVFPLEMEPGHLGEQFSDDELLEESDEDDDDSNIEREINAKKVAGKKAGSTVILTDDHFIFHKHREGKK